MLENNIGAVPILLLDDEAYSARLLLDNLAERGYRNVRHITRDAALAEALAQHAPVVFILNFHYHLQGALDACAKVKQLAPGVSVLAIASAGPAIKTVREYARQSRSIDMVIEKPLSDERFFLVLREVAEARLAARQLKTKAEQMEMLLPADAVATADRNPGGEAELFEAAVLFTDIRRSTELITQSPPQEFFSLLNHSLSAQARIISTFEGSVVKFTGDGVFAMFRGMGRAYLAVRCAMALSMDDSQQILPFGIGVADGLVLSGFVGDSYRNGARRQYDVVGATVNLAARLCGMAKPGEVVATLDVHRSAKCPGVTARAVEQVSIRGFNTPVDCVAYDALPPRKSAVLDV